MCIIRQTASRSLLFLLFSFFFVFFSFQNFNNHFPGGGKCPLLPPAADAHVHRAHIMKRSCLGKRHCMPKPCKLTTNPAILIYKV